MAVTNIQDDWQIQPTTATENAEIQANMAAALAEQQKAQEQTKEDAPASIYDDLANIWSINLAGKAKAIESAAEHITARDKERKEAEALLAKAKENKSNFFATLLEEQKPVRKEDEEKKLRNRAIIKGLGDLVGAVAAGAHAFGKRGMGYVPTLATSSPLKDIEKLNALQDEYLKRKEAWKALDLKIRMGDVDANTAEAQAAYTNAVERMKEAQKAYDDARKDYDTTVDDYHKDIADVAAEERKQDRMDARSRATQDAITYRATLNGKGEDEEDIDDADILDELFPWKPKTKKTESYDEEGYLKGYTTSKSTYSKAERQAEARGNKYVSAVKDLMKNEGLTKAEAISIVRIIMEEDAKAASQSLHNVARDGRK